MAGGLDGHEYVKFTRVRWLTVCTGGEPSARAWFGEHASDSGRTSFKGWHSRKLPRRQRFNASPMTSMPTIVRRQTSSVLRSFFLRGASDHSSTLRSLIRTLSQNKTHAAPLPHHAQVKPSWVQYYCGVEQRAVSRSTKNCLFVCQPNPSVLPRSADALWSGFGMGTGCRAVSF